MLAIGYAAGFVVSEVWLRALLIGIAMAVTIYLARLPTLVAGPPTPPHE